MQKRTHTSIASLGELCISTVNYLLLRAVVKYKTYPDEIVEEFALFANSLAEALPNLNESNRNKLKNIVRNELDSISNEFTTASDLRNDFTLFYSDHEMLLGEAFLQEDAWKTLTDFYAECAEELELDRQDDAYDK